MDVSKLKEDVDGQFEGVRQFEAVDRRFEEMLGLIATEGEKTRRHSTSRSSTSSD